MGLVANKNRLRRSKLAEGRSVSGQIQNRARPMARSVNKDGEGECVNGVILTDRETLKQETLLS